MKYGNTVKIKFRRYQPITATPKKSLIHCTCVFINIAQQPPLLLRIETGLFGCLHGFLRMTYVIPTQSHSTRHRFLTIGPLVAVDVLKAMGCLLMLLSNIAPVLLLSRRILLFGRTLCLLGGLKLLVGSPKKETGRFVRVLMTLRACEKVVDRFSVYVALERVDLFQGTQGGRGSDCAA